MQFRATTALLSGVLIAATLLVPAPALTAAGVPNDPGAVLHALNRLTFGPRPGDVERVQRAGLADWIDHQLNPRGLDDTALEERLPRPAPARPFDSPREARRAARDAIGDLAAAKLLRAAYTERQ